jgi:cilia- and flagella-associated protein 65
VVTYTPRAAGAHAFARFAVTTPGGGSGGGGRAAATLLARGAAEGPRLALSERAVDFGDVECGRAPSKVVYLQNASEVAAAYEFRDDGGGVVRLSRPRGVVPPRGSAHTRVTFAPAAPANYWRRLVCVVKARASLPVYAPAAPHRGPRVGGACGGRPVAPAVRLCPARN